MSAMLADGASVQSVVDAFEGDRIDPEALEEEARELLHSPSMELSRVLTVRLRAIYWWLAALAALQETSGTWALDRATELSRGDFLERYYYRNRPVLLPGIASEWPATQRWTRDYLSTACGAAIVEVMMNRTTADSSEQSVSPRLTHKMTFAEYVGLVYDASPGNDIYMVAQNRFFANPDTHVLLDDLGPLNCVETDARHGDVRPWFGPGGTLTRLHQDARNAMLIQILGSKDVRLYAPYYGAAMRQNLPWYAGADPASTELESPGGRAAREVRVHLQAGDALFLPVGWWHEVRSRDVSMSLSCFSFGVPNRFPEQPLVL